MRLRLPAFILFLFVSSSVLHGQDLMEAADSLIPIESMEAVPADEEQVTDGQYGDEEEFSGAGVTDTYFIDSIAKKEFGKASWKKHTGTLDYSEKKNKPEKKEKNKDKKTSAPPASGSPFNLSGAGQALLFILAIAILVLVLVYLLKDDFSFTGGKNKKHDQVNITFEEEIFETDLERKLRLALESGNYKDAIRFYYLMTMRMLADERLIELAKEKTNREYLREVIDQAFYREFRQLTLLFERAWYGDEPIQVNDMNLAAGWHKTLMQVKGGNR